ncbi:MAG: M48 family metalloprotease [Syntrophobacterales bacterium]|nr:M48 family metalloprotease [Syntrophobacterales bacterium]
MFYGLCKITFSRKEKLREISLKDYERTENFLSLLIIPFYAFLIYGMNIKYLLFSTLFLPRSVMISNLIGLTLYFVYLGIVWHSGYPLFCRVSNSSIPLKRHIESKFRFYTGMVLPWLILSLFSDVIDLVFPWKIFRTEEGHLIVIIVGFLMFSIFGIDFIVKVWQCKPFLKGPRRELIERFLAFYHFPIKDLLLWPSLGERALTAGIIGFLPRTRYILITPALNEALDDDEILAVIAHEMGHIRKFHMPLYFLLFLGYILIVYASSDLVILWVLSRENLIKLSSMPGVFSTTILSILTTLPFLIFLIFYFRFLFGYFSRNCERQADLYALELLGTPVPLASSLRKIALLSGYPLDRSNWHHYGILERIEFIHSVSFNPLIGKMHNRKLARSIKVWFITVTLLVILGLFIKKSSWFEREVFNVNLKIVAASANYSLDDPLFYAGYAGYLMEKGSHEYAERILLHGLERFKNNPELLNALAWLYATVPQPTRNPDKAIELAEKAIKLSPESPHIWDTLAEAYYSKGLYDRALHAIDRALSLNPSPKDYYLRQKEKIERRLME